MARGGEFPPPVPSRGMDRSLVFHRGELAAVVSADVAHLADEVLGLPETDPVRRLVAAKCVYAMEVLRGERPGPYRDAEATRFALGLVAQADEHMARRRDGVDRVVPLRRGRGRR